MKQSWSYHSLVSAGILFVNIRVVRCDRYQARLSVDREYYEKLYKDELCKAKDHLDILVVKILIV